MLIYVPHLISARPGSPMTIYFLTLGNCGICQYRIQNAVKDMPGVDTVYWNIPKKQTTVTYDESVTDPYIIMHAIANVGHDTEWFRAPDSAYTLLVGTCCEYSRIIDYDTVDVGWLSMMGIWIYPAAIPEHEKTGYKVYPTIGTGIFHLSCDNPTARTNPEISAFSLTGEKILSGKSLSSPGGTVDLRNFPPGGYLIVLSDKGHIIYSCKVIKTG